MAGRAKWEDMVDNVKKALSSDKKKATETTDVERASLVGSGGAGKAAKSIMDYKERQRRAIEDAGG